MALAVYDIQALYYSKFYLPIYVLIGGAIYLAMLRVTNAIKPEDVRLMKEYLGPRFAVLVRRLGHRFVGSQLQPNLEQVRQFEVHISLKAICRG